MEGEKIYQREAERYEVENAKCCGDALQSDLQTTKDNSNQSRQCTPIKNPLTAHCALCDLSFGTEKALQVHFAGKLHQKNQKIRNGLDTQDSNDNSLGVRHPSDQINKHVLYCEVCDVTCTGPVSMEAHLNGQKHAKKMRLKQGAECAKKLEKEINSVVSTTIMPRKTKRIALIQVEIESCDQPLIGLDYVTEFQKWDFSAEPLYICDLCEVKMDYRQVLCHVTGLKHRMKYFKYHSPGNYRVLFNRMKKSEKAKLAQHCAEVLEELEGRHKVRLKIEKSPSLSSLLECSGQGTGDSDQKIWEEVEVEGTRSIQELPGFWKCDAVDCIEEGEANSVLSSELRRPYSQRFRDPFDIYERPAVAPSGSKPSASDDNKCLPLESVMINENTANDESNSEEEQIKQLLENICSVENEEDAEIALHVSNALTKSLLEYRMKSLEGTNSMQDTLDEIKRELRNLSKKAKSIPIPKKDNHANSSANVDRPCNTSSTSTLITPLLSVDEHHDGRILSNERLSGFPSSGGQSVKDEPDCERCSKRLKLTELSPNMNYCTDGDMILELGCTPPSLCSKQSGNEEYSAGRQQAHPQGQADGIHSSSVDGFVVSYTSATSASFQTARISHDNITKPRTGSSQLYSSTDCKAATKNQSQGVPHSTRNTQQMIYSTADSRAPYLMSECVLASHDTGQQYRTLEEDVKYGLRTVSGYRKLGCLPLSDNQCMIPDGSVFIHPGMAGSQYSQPRQTTSQCRSSISSEVHHHQQGTDTFQYHEPVPDSSLYDKVEPPLSQYRQSQASASLYSQPHTSVSQYSESHPLISSYSQSQASVSQCSQSHPLGSQYSQQLPAKVQLTQPGLLATDVSNNSKYTEFSSSPVYKGYQTKELQPQACLMPSSAEMTKLHHSQPVSPPLPKEPPPLPPPPPPPAPPASPEFKRQRRK